MNKKVIIPLSLIAIYGAKKLHTNYLRKQFAREYPDQDPVLIYRAHRNLMKKAFMQQLDMTNWDREKYEGLLFKELERIS